MEVPALVPVLTEGVKVIGPLPTFHRIVLVLAALLVCAGLGIWAGLVNEVPVGVTGGIVAGVTAGLGAAYLLVHDRTHQPARAVRRPH